MNKNFDDWNNQKKRLEEVEKRFLFKTGDIWWCSIGLNLQHEACGKGPEYQRPVLVLKKLSGENFIGIPLSTQRKAGSWFIDITIHEQKRYVLLYQIRMYSTGRFQRRLATIDELDFQRVKEKLEELLELSYHHQSRSFGSVGNPKSN